jgi:hypothetical protein
VSAFHHTKEEGEKEAFEAAVEAMVRDVLLNVPDRRAATQKTLYEGRRQAALEALENVRYDEHGPTAPEALGVVRKGRAAVAAAVRFQKATGVPTRRTDWYWEEYKGEATAKSEFLVFVRLDMNSNERGAMIKHYTTPVTTGGATLLPAYPAAGWAVELDNKTALVVAKLGDGAMRAAGVRTGDLLLLDGDVAPGEVDRRLLAGVRGDDGAKLTIRRGRDLSQVFVPLIKAGGGSR